LYLNQVCAAFFLSLVISHFHFSNIGLHLRALLGLTSMVISPASYTNVDARCRKESLLYEFSTESYLLAADSHLRSFDLTSSVHAGEADAKFKPGPTRLCYPAFGGIPRRYNLNADIELALELSLLVERAIGINSQHHCHRPIENTMTYSGPDYFELHSEVWMKPLVDLPRLTNAARDFYQQNSSRFVGGNQIMRLAAKEIFDKQYKKVELEQENN
jgi:hypothetical protein